MKKILALVLALCLCCGIAVADTITEKSDSNTASTTVSYTIEACEEYTVTIPSSVKLENKSGTLSGLVSVRLDTSKFNVVGKTITVKLSEAALNLVNGASKIAYTLKNAGVEYKAGDTVLEWAYGGATDQTKALVVTAYMPSNLPAGDYSDTLTFTVSVTGGETADAQ